MVSRKIQRFSGIAMLACAMAFAACEKSAPRQGTGGDTATASNRNVLRGEWRWVASRRGSEVVRPTGPADSMAFELRARGGYRESVGGSTLQGHYSQGRGQLYQLQDSTFTVLVLDSSRFFPRDERQRSAVAVRSLAHDTLVLSGTGTDTTLYTFVRVNDRR